MTIRFILKSGVQFDVKCSEFTLKRNGLEQMKGYEIKGITENSPLYVDLEEVVAIIRVMSDEPETEDVTEPTYD